MSERVVITGLGVVSSLGCNPEEFWSNLTSGKSGISKVKSYDTSALERHYGGEVINFSLPQPFLDSEEAKLIPRTHQFALSACSSALRDAGLEDKTEETGVILGSIVGGLELVESEAVDLSNYPVYTVTSTLSNSLGFKGSVFTLSGACGSGNYALSLGYDRIRAGKEQIVATVGVDYFSASSFIGFHRLFSLAPFKCQPFDKNRQGIIPAEGAGVLILESLSSAQKRGVSIYAEVLGYGVSCDAYHPVIPSADGVFYCMKDALHSAGVNAGDIDYINAHGTGTIPNDKTECQAIKKLFGAKSYRKIPVSSIKSMLGHAMGAAASFEAISCCFSLGRETIPPTINFETPDPECDVDCVPNRAQKETLKIILNNSFGFGGMNCSLVLSRFES